MSLLLALQGGGGYTLTAEQGSFSVAGSDANLAFNRALQAEVAAISVAGSDATLTHTQAVDVKVSWLAFDTAATPVDVKVSWVAFDTAATPCDVRVSWICLDTAATTGYSAEVEIKRWYIKRKKRLYIFNSAEEADAYLAAEIEAVKAIEQAQRTSRRARKRLRDKLITVEPIQTVDIDWLSELVRHFQIQADLAQMLAQHDYEKVMQIFAMAMEMQEDEDIELLLLV